MIVNLDSDRPPRSQEKARRGRQDGRLRPPHARAAAADVYVSFDNVKVGTLQGEGLVKCLTDGG